MPRIAELPTALTLGEGTRVVVDDAGQTPSTRQYRAGVVGSIWGGAGMAYQIPIAQTGAYVIAEPPTFSLGVTNGFSVGAGQLACELPGWYEVHLNACFSLAAQAKEIRMRIALDGHALEQSCGRDSLGGVPSAPRVASLSTHTWVECVEGSVIGMAFANFTSADPYTLTNFQLTAKRVR
jgi:hypothetical protein